MEIDGKNNIQNNGNNNILYNGNIINNNFYNKIKHTQTEGEIPFTIKVYRQKLFILDTLFIAIGYVFIVFSLFYSLKIGYIITFTILLYFIWLYLPIKMYSLYVSVYSDRLSISNKDIMFKDIREWKMLGNKFIYIFNDDDIEHKIEFYSSSKPRYICYRIDKFFSFYGIEYHKL